ncbi:MAG: hypothetical protein ACRDJE_02725 [Dehalococcoidia bacterium]
MSEIVRLNADDLMVEEMEERLEMMILANPDSLGDECPQLTCFNDGFE